MQRIYDTNRTKTKIRTKTKTRTRIKTKIKGKMKIPSLSKSVQHVMKLDYNRFSTLHPMLVLSGIK